MRIISVTSLAEVWIEIGIVKINSSIGYVTSLAEVWIEITLQTANHPGTFRHFPRGSVD